MRKFTVSMNFYDDETGHTVYKIIINNGDEDEQKNHSILAQSFRRSRQNQTGKETEEIK
jgi:sensor domain CHASE-containing protein